MDSDSLQKEQTLLRIREDASEWFNPSPDKFVAFHEEWVKIKTTELTSDKYVNDHNGYLLSLGELRAHRKALDAYRTASDRTAKATKELEELKANFSGD